MDEHTLEDDTWRGGGPVPDGDDDLDLSVDESARSLALFEGDLSRLFPDQRRCLHALLKRRYLSAEHDPELWQTLQENTELITSRLNDVFLDLFIDRHRGIAFKQPAPDDGATSMPSLLRNLAHTKEETIVMVYLRRKFFASRQEGDEAVFVDRTALLDEVAEMRPEHATNRAMDHKRATKAIENLATAGILLGKSDADRFQISPIIEVLMPIEKLRALWTWLIEANQGRSESDEGDVAPADAHEEENDD